MILRSDLLHGEDNRHYYHRITWEPMEKEVIQTWEVLDSSHQVQTQLFKGFYRKSGS